MQIINGKLVLKDPNQLEYIDLQMENFTQHLEQIEQQLISVQQQDRRECINQLKIVKASVQNLQRSYIQLLVVTITTIVIVVVSLLFPT